MMIRSDRAAARRQRQQPVGASRGCPVGRTPRGSRTATPTGEPGRAKTVFRQDPLVADCRPPERSPHACHPRAAARSTSGRAATGAVRSPAAGRRRRCPASTVARPTLPRPPVTRMRMARNLPGCSRRLSAGPWPVAGGSSRLLHGPEACGGRVLSADHAPQTPQAPSEDVSAATRPSSVLARPGASVRVAVRERLLPSRPQLLRRERCASALRRSIAPPWSASALASQRCAGGPSPSARRPSGWRLMGDVDGCCLHAQGEVG